MRNYSLSLSLKICDMEVIGIFHPPLVWATRDGKYNWKGLVQSNMHMSSTLVGDPEPASTGTAVGESKLGGLGAYPGRDASSVWMHRTECPIRLTSVGGVSRFMMKGLIFFSKLYTQGLESLQQYMDCSSGNRMVL